MVVYGLRWSGHVKYRPDKVCGKPWTRGSILLLELQTLIATKQNSTVLVWCYELGHFNPCCWPNDSADSGYNHICICSISNLTNGTVNKNHTWLSQMDAVSKSSAVQNVEGRCTLQICQHFYCRRALSFITNYDDMIFFIRFHGRAHVHTLQPN